jgi:dihydroorotate dehydrogenase (NAD+) catalytic subunit
MSGFPDMSVEIAGIRMKNPVMVSSGTLGYGEVCEGLWDLGALGAFVTKTITLFPKEGNPPPRIAEVPSGILNSIGLQNVGVEEFKRGKLPYLLRFDVPIIVSIGGESIDEYVELARILGEEDGISGIELNISCPNVEDGMVFGSDPSLAGMLVEKVKAVSKLPVIPKLTPNVGDITAIARAVEGAGADAVSLINTVLGMAIDIRRRKPRLSRVVGGLSGPAIKPIALRMVWEVARAVSIPVIGMGGITNAEDAIEFLIAGATAVAVGTASFLDPYAPVKVIDGIRKYLLENGIESVRSLVGSLETE